MRKNAGVFDVSHMGEFIIRGPHALDLIQRVTSNDASKLTNGKVQYSCLPNEQGGIVDDLLVYCIEMNQEYMLVINASNIQKDWDWITTCNTIGAGMQNISDNTCLLAVQGPQACCILQSLTEMDILSLAYYSFTKGKFAGVDDVLISATGYTGAGGIDDIAIHLNVSPGFISHIESPHRRAKYNNTHLNELAKVFKCSPKDFFPEKPL